MLVGAEALKGTNTVGYIPYICSVEKLGTFVHKLVNSDGRNI